LQRARPNSYRYALSDGPSSVSLIVDNLRLGRFRLRGRRKERGMAKDPVCHMDVDPKDAAAQSKYQGQTYYFCAADCKRKFDADPDRYLSK
jgi:YHS domain-containing protein